MTKQELMRKVKKSVAAVLLTSSFIGCNQMVGDYLDYYENEVENERTMPNCTENEVKNERTMPNCTVDQDGNFTYQYYDEKTGDYLLSPKNAPYYANDWGVRRAGDLQNFDYSEHGKLMQYKMRADSVEEYVFLDCVEKLQTATGETVDRLHCINQTTTSKEYANTTDGVEEIQNYKFEQCGYLDRIQTADGPSLDVSHFNQEQTNKFIWQGRLTDAQTDHMLHLSGYLADGVYLDQQLPALDHLVSQIPSIFKLSDFGIKVDYEQRNVMQRNARTAVATETLDRTK